MIKRLLFTVCALLWLVPTWAQDGAVKPLLDAHAHNDYEQKRPLLDPADKGFFFMKDVEK